jgi:hypothetical protein
VIEIESDSSTQIEVAIDSRFQNVTNNRPLRRFALRAGFGTVRGAAGSPIHLQDSAPFKYLVRTRFPLLPRGDRT